MPEDQSEERFCDINIILDRYGRVGMSYSPKSGLKRQMVLLGHIWHYGIPRDDRFHGKPVRIQLDTPPDPELEEKIKTEEQVDSACGWFGVRRNVQATKVDEEVGLPPIRASITVTREAFEAVTVQATETLSRLHRGGATIRLVGKSLPESGDHIDSVFGLELTDLDVSEEKSYAVGGFEIEDTSPLYPSRNRVLPIECRLGKDRGARLSILMTGAGCHLDAATDLVHSVWCGGSIIKAEGKSYEGAHATVRFEEFDSDPVTGELPERALFGKFSYSPNDLNKEYSSSAPFWFYLKQVPDHARGLIIPILSQVAGAQVILTVELTNKEEELLVATDELEGSVRDYSFEVRSRLTNGSP